MVARRSKLPALLTAIAVAALLALASPAGLQANPSGNNNDRGGEPGFGQGRQVVIEVAFIQTTENFFQSIGVDFDLPGENGASPSRQPFSRPDGTVVGFESIDPPGLPYETPWISQISRQSASTLASIIDALDRKDSTVLLSAPRVLTPARRPARIFLGENTQYASGSQAEPDYKEPGVQLVVVPTVITDARIVLDIEIGVVGDGAAAVAGPVAEAPQVAARSARTKVTMLSGQTVALGGLLRDSPGRSGSSLPFLADVPVLGALFRSETSTTDQTELVIIVTPRLVSPVNQ